MISSECAEARGERCQEMAIKKSAEQLTTCAKTGETKVSTNEFDVVRSKIFSIYSVRSATIGKINTKIIKNTETLIQNG